MRDIHTRKSNWYIEFHSLISEKKNQARQKKWKKNIELIHRIFYFDSTFQFDVFVNRQKCVFFCVFFYSRPEVGTKTSQTTTHLLVYILSNSWQHIVWIRNINFSAPSSVLYSILPWVTCAYKHLWNRNHIIINYYDIYNIQYTILWTIWCSEMIYVWIITCTIHLNNMISSDSERKLPKHQTIITKYYMSRYYIFRNNSTLQRRLKKHETLCSQQRSYSSAKTTKGHASFLGWEPAGKRSIHPPAAHTLWLLLPSTK